MINKKRIRYALVILFLLYSGSFVSAQNRKIDSLNNVLQTKAEDTGKVVALLYLAKELNWAGKFHSALSFAHQSLQLSKSLKYKRGQGDAYLVLSQINNRNQDYSSAKKFIDSCIIIRQELNDERRLAEAYMSSAEIYQMEDNYTQTINQLLKAEKIYDALHDTSLLVYLHTFYGAVYTDYQITEMNTVI